MKEMLKSKMMILFMVFVVGVNFIQVEQIKMDSSNENNSVIENKW